MTLTNYRKNPILVTVQNVVVKQLLLFSLNFNEVHIMIMISTIESKK